MPHFHVTSARNRASIARHGLDWARMGAARGVAGSLRPEADGVFLCRDRFEADWFLTFDNGDGPFDLWAVDGVDDDALRENGNGHHYLPARIPPGDLTLVERDLTPRRIEPTGPSDAYGSALTITLDDGTVLSDDEVRTRLGGTAPFDGLP